MSIAAGAAAASQFCWQLRVYYEDTDAHGMVYHGSYVRFLDRARTEWLRSLGIDMEQMAAEDGLLFVVRSLQIVYHKPVRYGAMLRVVSYTINRSRSSMLIGQKIVNDADICMCEAEVRVVCIDAAKQRPQPLPSHVEELFQK